MQNDNILQNPRYTGIISVGIYLVFTNLVTMFLAKIIKVINIDINVKEGLLQLAVYLLLAILLLFVNMFFVKKDFNEIRKTKPGTFITIIIVGFVATIVTSNIVGRINNMIEYYKNYNYFIFHFEKYINATSNNQSTIVELMHSKGAIFMFLSAVFFGPFCEEIVFRQSLINVFKSKELGVFVSSLLFALIHVISSFGTSNLFSIYLMTIEYFTSGLVFGLIYYKTKNILYSTLVHMIYNTVALIGILLV